MESRFPFNVKCLIFKLKKYTMSYIYNILNLLKFHFLQKILKLKFHVSQKIIKVLNL